MSKVISPPTIPWPARNNSIPPVWLEESPAPMATLPPEVPAFPTSKLMVPDAPVLNPDTILTEPLDDPAKPDRRAALPEEMRELALEIAISPLVAISLVPEEIPICPPVISLDDPAVIWMWPDISPPTPELMRMVPESVDASPELISTDPDSVCENPLPTDMDPDAEAECVWNCALPV